MEHTGSEVSFLDLKITKEDNGQLSMKLFDKRDDFPFSIVRLPFSSSNMPTSMFYSSIGAEILRIGRVSSSLNNFLSSSKSLIKRALKQGASISRLEKTLKKTYGRQEVLKKFGKNNIVTTRNLNLWFDSSTVQFRSLSLDWLMNLKLGGITYRGPQCGHQ